MKFYYAGFNMYGQIRNVRQCIINSFTGYELSDCRNIECGHFAMLIQFDDKIMICGCANKKIEQHVKLNVSNDIIDMNVRDDMIILLRNDGKLLKILLNDLESITELPEFIHTECPDLRDSIIKAVFNGKMNAFLTKRGKVFNFSTHLDVKEEVEDICAGIDHCLVLSKSGNVYSFGQGSRGQLGHGMLENEINPILVEALAGVRIIKIAAGGWHSCALSSDGDLYTWGWNGNGQLGIKYEKEPLSVMATPHVVDVDGYPQINIVNVACGNRHTVFLSDDNRFFGMGWNKYSQLGNKAEQEDNYLPILLYTFNEKMFNLKCGPWNTVVF